MINIMICDDDAVSVSETRQLLGEILRESSLGNMPIHTECACSAGEMLKKAAHFTPRHSDTGYSYAGEDRP